MKLRAWITLGAASLFPAGAALGRGDLFDFEILRYQAKMLATRPYSPPPRAPEWLRRFNYDQMRRIVFNRGDSLWRRDGLPFEVQFFHPGSISDRMVKAFEVRDGRAMPIEFDRSWFDYDDLKLGSFPSDTGFAGVKLLYPLNHPDDELGVFLGTCYYRFLCAGARYGLSARAIALNSGTPIPEEFPLFTSFWVQRPARNARTVSVYALLDGPSVSGAYRFVITPGPETIMGVKAVLYFRRQAGLVGLAPLSSMFWHGENSTGPTRDYRPEVHDSDGLMIETGAGEWLWRPLTDPREPRTALFSDENPRGFGLMQRDRIFSDYQDLEADYQLRPGAWIEPVGSWGRGAIRLLELPTSNEFNDNISVSWTPADVPAPGRPFELEYRIHWCMDQIHPPAGYVVATRHGLSTNEPDLERFVVDFDGMYLRHQPADPAIRPVVSIGDGAKLVSESIQKNRFDGMWRVSFAVRPDGTGSPVEMRCFLSKPPHTLTETWSYLWQP